MINRCYLGFWEKWDRDSTFIDQNKIKVTTQNGNLISVNNSKKYISIYLYIAALLSRFLPDPCNQSIPKMQRVSTAAAPEGAGREGGGAVVI